MKKYSSLSNLKSFQNQTETKSSKGKKLASASDGSNKQFSMQGKLAAMQNTQRASGRRGN